MSGAGTTKSPAAAVFWQDNYIAEAPRFLAVAEGFPAPIRADRKAPPPMMMQHPYDIHTGARRAAVA